MREETELRRRGASPKNVHEVEAKFVCRAGSYELVITEVRTAS